jgi:hypothetical protein
MAEYPWRDKLAGDAPGCEHTGKPLLPMSEGCNFNSCCYLVVRWILVWDKDPESVCTTHNPKIHAPTFKPKESLA